MGQPPAPRPGQDRGELLTLRSLALESLQREALWAVLAVRAGRALLLCAGWTLVLGALVRTLPARWRLSRQLYAYARWHTDPAVRAAPQPPGATPPGPPPTLLGRRLVWAPVPRPQHWAPAPPGTASRSRWTPR